MMDELKKLREITETLTGNGYLRDQAEEWEYILDAIPNYVYVVDTQHKIKFANHLLTERLNKTKKQLYNKLCYKVINNGNADGLPKEWKRPPVNRKAQAIKEAYLSNMKGWFALTRSPIYTKTNKLIGFICVLQDITEKIKVQEKLRYSEQRYKLIVENVLDAIWTIDTKLNFTFINPAIKDLMGYDPEEWVGCNISKFATKEDFAYMAQKVSESLIEPNFTNVTFETSMINKAGQNIPIEINSKALRDAKGNVTGFQGRTRVL